MTPSRMMLPIDAIASKLNQLGQANKIRYVRRKPRSRRINEIGARPGVPYRLKGPTTAMPYPHTCMPTKIRGGEQTSTGPATMPGKVYSIKEIGRQFHSSSSVWVVRTHRTNNTDTFDKETRGENHEHVLPSHPHLK